jgi:GTP-binding protein
MLPVLAIVGRPNVGKSTLFNRLVGSQQAIVDDRPGVTRDRLYGSAEWLGREIMVVDTGGFEPDPAALDEGDMFIAVRRQAEVAIAEADVILFVVDRQVGLTPADKLTAGILRKQLGDELEQRLILVVNKCDGPKHDDDAVEFYALGLHPMMTVSAEHGRGNYELWDAIVERLPPATGPVAEHAPIGALVDESMLDDDGERIEQEFPDEIRIAVLGRPNIGKSTLVNRLVGEERHVVHDMPGTTMDAVDSVVEVDGQSWRIIDTAGIRRKARIDDRLETFATLRAIRTIERCHLVLLVIDGREGPTTQDARLAALITERGRACIILINRWDEVKNDPERNAIVLQDEIAQALPHLRWAPELYISALTGKGCHRILPLVLTIYKQFDKHVSTAKLNKFLEQAVHAHSVPQRYHRPVRLNYMTQARVRPPTFVVWSNTPEGIKDPYKRYLENRLRDEWGFDGSPIRLHFRKKRKPGEGKYFG